MPAPGLSWNDVDLFNAQTYEANRDRPLDDIRDEYETSYRLTVTSVESQDEPTLFDPAKNPLGTGEPLWQYAAANTSEHYREHRESLEAWLAARG
jgi:hypothetical protein